MSSQISQSVIKALHKLVGETPYFVTMVELESDQKFMILGQRQVFFVDNSLRKNATAGQAQDDFKYEEIRKIKYYRSHRNFFKLELHNQNEPKLITSEDAPNLINSLKCYWQIDNMNRTLSFRELRIDIASKLPEDEEEMNSNLGLLGAKSAPTKHMHVDPGYDYHMQKSYKFALKRSFERDQKKNSQFVDTSSAHTGQQNVTDVQVFEMTPVDYLDKMTDEKADLKTYGQNAALELIDSRNTVHLLMESRPYIKKYNLTQDRAQWSAWQVHLRIEEPDTAGLVAQPDNGATTGNGEAVLDQVQVHERDLFVTAVRRKYIPPLMECYQDMLVISVYNYEKSATEVEKARASKRFLREVHQKVVDTLHPQNNLNTNIYHVFVTQKANALLMDEQSMGFFEEQLNIRPELAFFACTYVKALVGLFKDAGQITVQHKREFKSMAYQLKTQMLYFEGTANSKQNQQQQKQLAEEKDPATIREFMERWSNGSKDASAKMQAFASKAEANISKARSKKDNKRRKKTAVWRKKVARYLAYCVDGGLLQSKFTLLTVVTNVEKLENDVAQKIHAEIAYLLHCHKRETPWDVVENLKDQAKDIDPQNDSFNQHVMAALIKFRYLQGLMKAQKTYPKFLTAMLRDDYGDDSASAQPQSQAAAQSNALSEVKEIKYDLMSRTRVKEACCLQIVGLFEGGDDPSAAAQDKGGKGQGGDGDDGGKRNRANIRANDDDKVEFVKLVEPLMQTMKSDNQELAALATSALVNLCSYSPDIKQIFVTKDGLGVILEYLHSKKEIILLNVLRLIQVFIANSEQFTKNIAEAKEQEAVKSLLQILNGPGIGGVVYSTRVYYYVIMILRQMIRYFALAKEEIINSPSLETIILMLEPQNLSNIPPDFEVKIYQFLIQLVKEDMDKKKKVGAIIFVKVFKKRLTIITTGDPDNNSPVQLFIPSTHGPANQSYEIEYNFFKLMHFLTKTSIDNQKLVQGLTGTLQNYLDNHCQERTEIRKKIESILNEVV